MPIPVLSGALVAAALAVLPDGPAPETLALSTPKVKVRDIRLKTYGPYLERVALLSTPKVKVRDIRNLPTPEKLMADARDMEVQFLWRMLARSRKHREELEKRADAADFSRSIAWEKKQEREYTARLTELGETVTDEEITRRIRDLPPPVKRPPEPAESKIKRLREKLEDTRAMRERFESRPPADHRSKMIAMLKKQEREYEDQLKALGVTVDDKK